MEPDDLDDLAAVGVFARIRPGSDAPRDPSIVVRKRYDVAQDLQVRNLEFSLDWVFDSDASQEEVYEIVAEQRVARLLRGYNVEALFDKQLCVPCRSITSCERQQLP